MSDTYLTYEEYVAYGGSMPQSEFPVAEMKARKKIDRYTDCRVQNMATVPEEVKMCVYALIRIEASIGVVESIDKPKLASFQTDGYSETYVQPITDKSAQKAVEETINSLLYGVYDDYFVPLLFKGVSQGA